MRTPHDLRSDAGETLVETLVALAILGVAAVAILAGLQLSTKASDIHRKQTTGGAYARSYAEQLEKWISQGDIDHYVPCASPGPTSPYRPEAIGFTPPDQYSAQHEETKTWDPTLGKWVDCPATDPGVQRVRLSVPSIDGRAAEELTVVLRRSCDPSKPCTN